MTLGDRLRRARERKGWSQLHVSKLTKISNTVLSNYEKNYRDPDSETLAKLAELYEVSTDYLLGLSPDKTTQPYPYDGIINDLKEKYPSVDFNDPDIRRKFMKVIDLVLDDHLKK